MDAEAAIRVAGHVYRDGRHWFGCIVLARWVNSMKLNTSTRKTVLNPAREEQRPVVAFQGASGAFSDEAVRLIWTGQATSAPNRDFLSAVQAIATGRADYAVLPVENTSAGLITGSLEAISKALSAMVVGEYTMLVRHCLLGQPDATIDGLRRVFSHPAALAQCTQFFAVYPAIAAIDAYDTAGAAADVALRGDAAEAAIASERAATLYGLSVLASDIQDDAANATRFVILASARYEGYPDAWKRPDLFVDGTPARDYKVGL